MDQLLSQFNLTNNQLNQLDQYYQLLVTTNQQFNLTSITDHQEVYIKHFYDCLLLNNHLHNTHNLHSSIIDIGSGAGFPGIVLKIANPNLNITLLEPTTKRANFLIQTLNSLNLPGVVLSTRAEDYQPEQLFDYATSRAVAKLNILLELSIPLLKIGGKLLALKGSNYQEEISDATKALKTLGATISNIYKYQLPNDSGTRVIIEITKNQKTNPLYPRPYAKIKKQPL